MKLLCQILVLLCLWLRLWTSLSEIKALQLRKWISMLERINWLQIVNLIYSSEND